MKLDGKIPLLFIAFLAWVLVISSCANQGMPIGGPKDTIPPVLVGTNPEFKSLNFEDDRVSFSFNEFILSDEVSETLVISPPLEKRPIIRRKGRSLIVQFNEDLKEDVTYSMDFKNSIVDNNEKNPFPAFRFAFSTGDVFDSLKVSGNIMNAFNLEPIEKALIFLHSDVHDSAVYRVRPDYIAKSDETGLFLIDNIAPGSYNLFALSDLNNDLMYNEGAEPIAFVDSIIVPHAHFHEEVDTVVKGLDSLVVMGHTHFYPEPVFLRLFTEDIFDQYLNVTSRETRHKCLISFNETVKDSFEVRILDEDTDDWYIMETNPEIDSFVLWIADTTIANKDSLFLELSYLQLDSAQELYLHKDTVDMFFSDKKVEPENKRKRSGKKEEKEEEEEKIEQFRIENNASRTFDINTSLHLTMPRPVYFFDSTQINLYLKGDTLKQNLDYVFEKDTAVYRQYNIHFNWAYNTEYILEIDSAACTDIYGITSERLRKEIKTREDDYYGEILLSLSNVPCPLILQLLDNNDAETLIDERITDKDGQVVFDFVHPEKYKIKVIYDENDNGVWDNGSFQDKIQPERIAYLNEVVKVRSNFDTKFIWDLDIDFTFKKNIRDLELEERKRKEEEERLRKERENPEREPLQNNNMLDGTGVGTGGQGEIFRR